MKTVSHLLACLTFSLHISGCVSSAGILRDAPLSKRVSQFDQVPPENSDSYTLKHNITVGKSSNSSNVEPIDWDVPDTSITIRFEHYGWAITRESLFGCLILVYRDIVAQLIRQNGDHYIDVDDASWDYERAEIYIENLGPEMSRPLKWSTLASLLSGIAAFSYECSYTSAAFDIIDRSLCWDSIGGGFIRDKERPTSFKKTTETSR
ncbi:MAG: hypothetical protein Q9217_002787 [Psora testacea]